MDALTNIFLLGVRVTKASESEVLEFIIRSLKKNDQKMMVVTLNPEILVFANKNRKFKAVLNTATLGLPDGMGVIWGGKFLGKNLQERITGIDLMEKLCQRAEEEGLTVGFLGGRDDVALKTAECLRQKYPKLKVGFTGEEWPFARGPVRSFLPASARPPAGGLRAVGSPSTSATPRSTIDILFVAFGFPKQELWIAKNLSKIPVKMAMGVGGAFDYLSGQVPRAPKWAQAIGLEWLFRLVRQPWRVKRQLALVTFIYLIIKQQLAIGDKSINN